MKSELDEKNRPAENEKTGKLGEVDRGSRGKNEIAITFGPEADAECFDVRTSKRLSQFLIDCITSKRDAEPGGAIVLLHVGVRSTADALHAINANL